MSGRIPRAFIDELLARTDIVDVIDAVVPLRKAGKDYQARCPFHEEKTPSFTVSRDKQFFHCFGCQKSGTAIGFLMEYSNLGFVEAVEELASRAGLTVPREGGEVRPSENFSEIYELLELVVRFYRRQLKEHPLAHRAVAYLKQRGVSGEMAAKFELGFAPPGWETLAAELGKSGPGKERLAKAGMLLRRAEDGSYYDRFRDRIMFPIRDQRGRVIGFGGRVLDDGTPKYLNSPETPVFHKGRELYALNHAKAGKAERLFVVEGYMDVLALCQHGVEGAVATLGTAATVQHLERMFRVTSNIVFCFDGDTAGRRAAHRAMEIALPLLHEGRQVFFRFIPEGDDPDTYVRRAGREEFENPDHWTPLLDLLVETLETNIPNLHSHQGKAELIDRAGPVFQRLPEGGFKRQFLEKVGQRAGGQSPERLEWDFRRASKPSPSRPGKGAVRPASTRRTPDNMVIRLIRLLLHQPNLAVLAENPAELRGTGVPGADFLAEMLELLHTHPHMSCAALLEHWRDTPYQARLSALAAPGVEFEADTFDPEREFLDVLAKFRDEKRKQRLQDLTKVKRIQDLSEDERATLKAVLGHAETGAKK